MNTHLSGKAAVAMMILAVAMATGCKSKQDEAIDQAKKQAAATGQAQQVVSTDKNGNVTTTTVQPPAPGQTTQAVTTTVTPANGAVPANTPATAGGVAPIALRGRWIRRASLLRDGSCAVRCCSDHSSGGREYCGRNGSDDSDQSTHQREDESSRETGSQVRWSIRWWVITTRW